MSNADVGPSASVELPMALGITTSFLTLPAFGDLPATSLDCFTSHAHFIWCCCGSATGLYCWNGEFTQELCCKDQTCPNDLAPEFHTSGELQMTLPETRGCFESAKRTLAKPLRAAPSQRTNDTMSVRRIASSREALVLLHENHSFPRLLCCKHAGQRVLSANNLCFESDHVRVACCYGVLESWASAASAPPWMENEIKADVATLMEVRRQLGVGHEGLPLTSAMFDDFEARWKSHVCRLKIRNRQLVQACDTAQITYAEEFVLGSSFSDEAQGVKPGVTRAVQPHISDDVERAGWVTAIEEAVHMLLELFAIPDVDLLLSTRIFEDRDYDMPVLSKARQIGARGLIRIPSFEVFQGYVDRALVEMSPFVAGGAHLIPWEDRQPKAFWRGMLRGYSVCEKQPCPAIRETGAGNASNRCGCQLHQPLLTRLSDGPRGALVSASLRYPELINAKFISASTLKPATTMLEREGWLASWADLEEHLGFRYLVSVDGQTIDDVRWLWILLSGSLLLKQTSALEPVLFPALEPFKHYLPLRHDLQDLPEKVRWAQAHDADCRRMVERVTAWATQAVLQQPSLHYLYRVIIELQRIQMQ